MLKTTPNNEQKAQMSRQVYAALEQITEPTYQLNVVDLGLIYQVEILDTGIVRINFTFPQSEHLSQTYWVQTMQQSIEKIPGVQGVDLLLQTEPVWSLNKMSAKAKKEKKFVYIGGSHE